MRIYFHFTGSLMISNSLSLQLTLMSDCQRTTTLHKIMIWWVFFRPMLYVLLLPLLLCVSVCYELCKLNYCPRQTSLWGKKIKLISSQSHSVIYLNYILSLSPFLLPKLQHFSLFSQNFTLPKNSYKIMLTFTFFVAYYFNNS